MNQIVQYIHSQLLFPVTLGVERRRHELASVLAFASAPLCRLRSAEIKRLINHGI